MGQFIFFTIINQYLTHAIYAFQWNLLTATASLVGFVALVVLTIWVMLHGYQIVTGTSRQPLMVLVNDSLRAALIIMVATSMAAGGKQLYWTLSDGLSTSIVSLVTGSSESPFQQIDNNLAYMQLGLTTLDSLQATTSDNVSSDITRDKWFSGAGMAGPAVIAGSMLLLNKIALGLFIGLGPLFILCLIFKQTAPLFQRWLLYGIGTLFSLAVLSVMVGIAMQMLAAIIVSYMAQYAIALAAPGTSTDGLNSMALQQGGIGLILTTLIISAPPMAASFFQGTLANFAAYNGFGNIGAPHAPTPQIVPGPGGQLVPAQATANQQVAQSTRSTSSYNNPAQVFGLSSQGQTRDEKKYLDT